MKKINIETAENLAYKFRFKNGISESEAINTKSILRKLNIITAYRPLSEKSYGLSLIGPNGIYFILVNSNTTRGRQHFTIAHELYHIFFDENPKPHICSDGVSDVAEINANLFASALLLPKAGLIEFLSNEEIKHKNVGIATIIRMEQYFSVSRQSILFRLKRLGYISEVVLQDLLKIPAAESARNYGYDTSLYGTGNKNLFIGDFGEKARKLYDMEKISEGRYMEILNMIGNVKGGNKNDEN